MTFKVGDGATMCVGSDRYAGTIISVKPGRGRVRTVVEFQHDNVRRIDNNGMSDSQEWECTPNPQGAIEVFSERRDGMFREVGSSKGRYLRPGRSHFYDFSF